MKKAIQKKPYKEQRVTVAKTFIFILLFVVFVGKTLYSQDNNVVPQEPSVTNPPNNTSSQLETASDFMDKVAEVYSGFEDFQANIEITNGTSSKGVIYSKPPNKMRINFSNPAGQVIVSDGEEFFVYIPQQNVVLYQEKQDITSTSSFISRSGLDQLRKKYVASYADKPYFVTLPDSKSRVKVMQIRMRWRNTSQNFRELLLSIGSDYFIYRVEVITYNRAKLQFDFSNIQVNKGIPDARFTYNSPATANVIENFLFKGEIE